jgi:hypothetical protein
LEAVLESTKLLAKNSSVSHADFSAWSSNAQAILIDALGAEAPQSVALNGIIAGARPFPFVVFGAPPDPTDYTKVHAKAVGTAVPLLKTVVENLQLRVRSVYRSPNVRSSAQVLTVLMISASPDTRVRLRVDREFREIIARMRGARHRERFRFEQVQAARFDDLRTALMEHQPHVLHISSHGESDGALVFEGDTEGKRKLPIGNMVRLLELLRDNLQIVVINACDSHRLAQQLSLSVGLAIGMSDKVEDAAAIDFAVAFYEALGFGKSVETAFKIALAGLDTVDDDVPQLFPPASNDPQCKRSSPLISVDLSR